MSPYWYSPWSPNLLWIKYIHLYYEKSETFSFAFLHYSPDPHLTWTWALNTLIDINCKQLLPLTWQDHHVSELSELQRGILLAAESRELSADRDRGAKLRLSKNIGCVWKEECRRGARQGNLGWVNCEWVNCLGECQLVLQTSRQPGQAGRASYGGGHGRLFNSCLDSVITGPSPASALRAGPCARFSQG